MRLTNTPIGYIMITRIPRGGIAEYSLIVGEGLDPPDLLKKEEVWNKNTQKKKHPTERL